MKEENIFDVPLDSELGQEISAVAQAFAEDLKKASPELFADESIPEMMLAIKKFWNEGILMVDYDEETKKISIFFNPFAAINWLQKEVV